MASDISLAVGDGARRMTYTELAQARGMSQASARRLVRRHAWAKQIGNDGVVRVTVPLGQVRTGPGSSRANVPENGEFSGPGQASALSHGSRPTPVPDRPTPGPGTAPVSDGTDLMAQAMDGLRQQLVIANDHAERAERRADELQALLTEERRQAQTSAPDIKGVVREVIREIAGAAPPDDGDGDGEALRTLESAIAALREQVDYAQSGLVAERQRADELQVALTEERRRVEAGRQLVEDGRKRIDELQQRVDELHTALADAVTAERIAAGEAAALRAIVTGLRARPWWRRWLRG